MIKKYAIMLLQITVLCNAILCGWRIKVVGNKIILRKKIIDMMPIDHDLEKITTYLVTQ